jgi:Arm DNA-binding domain
MALGSYPTVSLKQARSARDEARKVHATGKDPVTDRLNEPSLRRPLKRWRATSTPPKDYQGVDKRAALT